MLGFQDSAALERWHDDFWLSVNQDFLKKRLKQVNLETFFLEAFVLTFSSLVWLWIWSWCMIYNYWLFHRVTASFQPVCFRSAKDKWVLMMELFILRCITQPMIIWRTCASNSSKHPALAVLDFSAPSFAPLLEDGHTARPVTWWDPTNVWPVPATM